MENHNDEDNDLVRLSLSFIYFNFSFYLDLIKNVLQMIKKK